MGTNFVINNLKASYGKKKNLKIVLDNFNYEFKTGMIYFIMGKSGSGKTTLLSYLDCLKKSNDAIISYNNIILSHKNFKNKNIKKLRQQVGFVFQNAQWQLFKNSIIKDTMFGLNNFLTDSKNNKEIASKYLNKIGISNKLFDKSPFEVSNGQQKRVALAGTLAYEPTILLLDEPTSGLDWDGLTILKNIIINFKKQNKIVIIVSHDVNFAYELADQIIVLNNKKIMYSNDAFTIFNKSDIDQAHLVKPEVLQIIDSFKNNKKIYNELLQAKPRSQKELINILERGQ